MLNIPANSQPSASNQTASKTITDGKNGVILPLLKEDTGSTERKDAKTVHADKRDDSKNRRGSGSNRRGGPPHRRGGYYGNSHYGNSYHGNDNRSYGYSYHHSDRRYTHDRPRSAGHQGYKDRESSHRQRGGSTSRTASGSGTTGSTASGSGSRTASGSGSSTASKITSHSSSDGEIKDKTIPHDSVKCVDNKSDKVTSSTTADSKNAHLKNEDTTKILTSKKMSTHKESDTTVFQNKHVSACENGVTSSQTERRDYYYDRRDRYMGGGRGRSYGPYGPRQRNKDFTPSESERNHKSSGQRTTSNRVRNNKDVDSACNNLAKLDINTSSKVVNGTSQQSSDRTEKPKQVAPPPGFR